MDLLIIVGKYVILLLKKTLEYWLFIKNGGGVADTRNAGLDIASGSYISFVDSDDYICQNMYERMMAKFDDNPEIDIVICNYKLVYPDKTISASICDEIIDKDEVYNRLQGKKCWDYIPFWNRVCKKSIFDNVRCPIGRLHEDNFIVHELIANARKICCVSDPLYYYIQRDGSIMHSGINIRRMDNILALYERCKFYQREGKTQYLPALASLALIEYNWTRWYVVLKNDDDIEELELIDKVIKDILLSGGKKVPLKCKVPGFYTALMHFWLYIEERLRYIKSRLKI